MKITWQVDDGYIGNRTHHTEIPDDELECYEGQELEDFITDRIQDEFEQKITWYITDMED